ncbi:hypothetical protein HKD37_16G045274 [Glycine soja]
MKRPSQRVNLLLSCKVKVLWYLNLLAHLQRTACPHLRRATGPHHQRTTRLHLQRATRPRHQRTACPHLERTTRPRHQRAARPHLQRTTRPCLERAARPHLQRTTRPRLERATRPHLGGLHVLTIRGLHALTSRGLHVLALRGLHALTLGLHVLALRGLHVLTIRGLHALTSRGLHVLALRGLHALTLGTSYPHRQRTTRPRLERTTRPRLERTTRPHHQRAARPHLQRTIKGYTPSPSEDYTSSPLEDYTSSPSEDYMFPIFKGGHALTFRGLHVLAIIGLHSLAFERRHVLNFRGLHALAFRRLRFPFKRFLGHPLILEEGQLCEHNQRGRLSHSYYAYWGKISPVPLQREDNILPSDRNANLPLLKYQLVCAVPTWGSHPQRHPMNLKKSNRALGFPALVTGLYQSYRGSRLQDTQWTRRSPTGSWSCQALITGLYQFYGVPVTSSKGIRPPTNRAFIKKYCAPRQAQGETPQQHWDGRHTAITTKVHLSSSAKRLERCLRHMADQQATKSKAKGIAPTRHPVDPEKSNRALGFPALVTGLYQSYRVPVPPRQGHVIIGIVPARHLVDPKKANRVLELSSSNYGVPVTSSKGIRPPTNQAFIKKYCVSRQAQGKTPQQHWDGWQRATDAPPSPLEFTSAHPQKGLSIAYTTWPSNRRPSPKPNVSKVLGHGENTETFSSLTSYPELRRSEFLIGGYVGAKASLLSTTLLFVTMTQELVARGNTLRGGRPDDTRRHLRGGGPDDTRRYLTVIRTLVSSRGGRPDDTRRYLTVIRTLLSSRGGGPDDKQRPMWPTWALQNIPPEGCCFWRKQPGSPGHHPAVVHTGSGFCPDHCKEAGVDHAHRHDYLDLDMDDAATQKFGVCHPDTDECPRGPGMVPTRHPLDPEKSNRALGFSALIMGLCQSYEVPVTPNKAGPAGSLGKRPTTMDKYRYMSVSTGSASVSRGREATLLAWASWAASFSPILLQIGGEVKKKRVQPLRHFSLSRNN